MPPAGQSSIPKLVRKTDVIKIKIPAQRSYLMLIWKL